MHRQTIDTSYTPYINTHSSQILTLKVTEAPLTKKHPRGPPPLRVPPVWYAPDGPFWFVPSQFIGQKKQKK